VLGLADVRLDLVPGPVRMHARQLTVADASALLDELRARTLPPPDRANAGQ
jgi:putative membrane protein